MELWRYKAMDARGKVLRGRLEAGNPGDLEARLGRLGLDLITFSPARGASRLTGARRVRPAELVSFCLQLEHLLRAGVPIVDALTDLRDTVTERGFREILGALVEAIQGGQPLSRALEAHPQVFDGVFVSLVRAGEQSGRLPELLHRLVDNLKWQDEQAAQTRRLLLYPALVGSVVAAALAFLMLHVVPQLVGFLQNMGQSLPWQTRALIRTSEMLADHAGVLLLAGGAITLGIALARRHHPGFAHWVDARLLHLPMVGPLVQRLVISRVCGVIAVLYRAGIPVLDCLRSGEAVAGNRAIARAVREAARRIGEGGGLSASFLATELFPPLVIRMLRVGESTGALDDALENVTYFFTREARETVARLQTLIMPVLTVMLGGVVLWIVSAVLGPLYGLFTELDL
jgi:type IV pilus assembly protein PilC